MVNFFCLICLAYFQEPSLLFQMSVFHLSCGWVLFRVIYVYYLFFIFILLFLFFEISFCLSTAGIQYHIPFGCTTWPFDILVAHDAITPQSLLDRNLYLSPPSKKQNKTKQTKQKACDPGFLGTAAIAVVALCITVRGAGSLGVRWRCTKQPWQGLCAAAPRARSASRRCRGIGRGE